MEKLRFESVRKENLASYSNLLHSQNKREQLMNYKQFIKKGLAKQDFISHRIRKCGDSCLCLMKPDFIFETEMVK